MSETLIPWEKLNGDRRKTFEEFCYQIANGLYGQTDRVTSINDSGGGDGVEFYLTLSNGDIWGWQAKFFFPGGRLKISNRKEHIKESLQKAYTVHGKKLKKWFLCTPLNLTTDDQKWFDEKLATSILGGTIVLPNNHNVELDNWGESDFNNWRRETRFNGINRFFFGELELNIDWFERQVNRQMQGVMQKYDPILHTETDVDTTIHKLLGDLKAKEIFQQECDEIGILYKEYREQLANIMANRVVEWIGEGARLIESAELLTNELKAVFAHLNIVQSKFQEAQFDDILKLTQATLIANSEKSLHMFTEIYTQLDWDKLSHIGNENYEQENRKDSRRSIERLGRTASSIISQIKHLENNLQILRQTDLHIFGDPGSGKTHLACNICTERIKENLPALFVLGKKLSGDSPLHKQLLELFDVPRSYTWNDFLRALDTAATVYGTRIPIVIDGLNETLKNGRFSDIWAKDLPSLIADIMPLQNVVLITTSRNSYKDGIWTETKPQNTEYIDNFYEDALETLITKYFQVYKIQPELTDGLMEEFSHPIYLKIFCEIKNPDRKHEKLVHAGQQTLFEVFDEYLTQCNRTVCNRLGYHPRQPILIDGLEKIAEYLWENRSKKIPISQAVALIDGTPLKEIKEWELSKSKALENEGLLVCRDWGDEEEVYYFTYDLLGGYLIAKQLLKKNAAKIKAFLNQPQNIELLYSKSYANQHPFAEDVRRCIAALLPVQNQGYLHDLVDHPSALSDSIIALFEISPTAIDDSCLHLIENIFQSKSNQQLLLELSNATVANIHHPLNMTFWHNILLKLPMPDRDIGWTEYVRQTESIERRWSQLETLCKQNNKLTDLQEQRLNLLARFFMWTLTTSSRPIRDRSTRALYWYGRKFPSEFFELLIESFEINDPYISERMLAAAYGVSMALHVGLNGLSFVHQELNHWGRILFESMFKPDAKYSTTHFLTRDYALQIVELAIRYNPEMLSKNETEYVTQPFKIGGIRDWGECEEKEKGTYDSDGPKPLMMDFENYTLGGLVSGRSNYDYDHPEYQKIVRNIYWRIYQLGYSRKRFGEVDRWIDGTNQHPFRNHDDIDKTERYGKKYSWIVYFELLGYLVDSGKYLTQDTWWEGRDTWWQGRDFDTDIDPSFPEDPTSYRIITDDLLGDANMPTQDWIENGDVPNLSNYLVMKRIGSDDGDWVLLDGHVSQEDSVRNRNRFTFIRSLFVKAHDTPDVIDRLTNQNMGNRWLPEIPETGFLYAGEIPWHSNFSHNDWEELEFVVSTQLIEIPEEKLEQKEKYEVIIPVRQFTRHFHHTLKSGGRCVILAKQISEALKLVGKPQTFDLFTHNGSKATTTTYNNYESEDNDKDDQHFLYLRQDLLNKYLKEQNLKLVWIIWGERQYSVKTMANRAPAYQGSGAKPWKVFQSVIPY